MPKDKEEKLITYIKKFVDKHGFGPRSEDIINKFVPSSWSSKSSLFYHLGKLIDCRNLDKRADPEKAGDHYLRYFINETYDNEAKKIELAISTNRSIGLAKKFIYNHKPLEKKIKF